MRHNNEKPKKLKRFSSALIAKPAEGKLLNWRAIRDLNESLNQAERPLDQPWDESSCSEEVGEN